MGVIPRSKADLHPGRVMREDFTINRKPFFLETIASLKEKTIWIHFASENKIYLEEELVFKGSYCKQSTTYFNPQSFFEDSAIIDTKWWERFRSHNLNSLVRKINVIMKKYPDDFAKGARIIDHGGITEISPEWEELLADGEWNLL
jgi:hypothetical protein